MPDAHRDQERGGGVVRAKPRALDADARANRAVVAAAASRGFGFGSARRPLARALPDASARSTRQMFAKSDEEAPSPSA